MNLNLEELLVDLITKAETELPNDVMNALESAYQVEKSSLGKVQLEIMIENAKLAREQKAPICQDTGVITFFVKTGRNFKELNFKEAAFNAVKKATAKIPLRPSIVDPITRVNSGNNTSRFVPHVYIEQGNEEFTEITVFPKGAGSENLTTLRNFTPSTEIEEVKSFIVRTIAEKVSKACPPGRIGVGIGGTGDFAVFLSKKALLKPIGTRNRNERIAKLERELIESVNKLGIGPMGLGGKNTILDLSIEWSGCHTASLPVGVSFQCWADRRASLRIYEDREVTFI